MLRVTARDASLWHFFSGNEAVLEKNLTIDITPPTLELIADDRYVNFGGVGAIVYKASADTATSGVKIGDYFFPGFPGQVKDHPDHFLALFAHPYNAPPEARPTLVATDKAGNTREMRLAYELKNVRYKKSTLAHIGQLPAEQGGAAAHRRHRAAGRAKGRLRRREQAAAEGKRGPHHRDHEEGHALDAVEGRVRPAQQLEGRGELRGPADVHLQRRNDRYRVPPRLRPLGHEELPGRSLQQRHRGLHRRPRASTATP